MAAIIEQARSIVGPPRTSVVFAVPSEPDGRRTLGSIGYLEPQADRPFNYMFEPPPDTPWQNCAYCMTPVPILDARTAASTFSLDADGFVLLNAPTEVDDFGSDTEIEANYYSDLERIALSVTGGRQAIVFDHLVRNREAGRPPLTFGRYGDGSQPAAVGRAHNDYTEASGQRRLGLVLRGSRDPASVSRYCIINIWRPLNGPVLDTPLAVCDARSVAVRDLVATDLYYPTRTGEAYLLSHSPYHRWRYYSEMCNDEVLIFKQYDSQVSGVSRFTPHAAFDHPETPPDAPLRRSIEARCLVLFD